MPKPRTVTNDRLTYCAETGSRCKFVYFRPMNFSHFPSRICEKCGRHQIHIAGVWQECVAVR